MTAPQHMRPARRRPIPGTGRDPSAARSPHAGVAAEAAVADAVAADRASGTEQPADAAAAAPGAVSTGPPDLSAARASAHEGGDGREVVRRRAAADYSTTRLVNFRIPVDLHERYRELIREIERKHPRLRHPSLTELVIALLEEGPETGGEVAELIRRKRAAEHSPREVT